MDRNHGNTKYPEVSECAKCGACTSVCPVYRITGRESLTARGRLHIIGRQTGSKPSSTYGDILSKCLLCGACEDVCPRTIKTMDIFIKARRDFSGLSGGSFLKYISCKALIHPGLLAGLTASASLTNRLLADHLPADSGLRLRLAALDTSDLGLPPASYIVSRKETAAPDKPGNTPSTTYFIGCLANHLQPEIADATVKLLQLTGDTEPLIPRRQSCCGLPAMAAGDIEEARRLAKMNIAAFDEEGKDGQAGSTPILTSCGSCYSHLSSYPDLLAGQAEWHPRAIAFQKRLREFSTFFDSRLAMDQNAVRPDAQQREVFYHDPCHLRFGHKITAEPRRLLDRLKAIKQRELPGGPKCCGQGGLFHIGHPLLSKLIHDRLHDQMSGWPVQTVVTTCSGCLLQWQQGLKRRNSPARAMHLGILLLDELQKR